MDEQSPFKDKPVLVFASKKPRIMSISISSSSGTICVDSDGHVWTLRGGTWEKIVLPEIPV